MNPPYRSTVHSPIAAQSSVHDHGEKPTAAATTCSTRYAGSSDIGCRRASNDDRWAADPTQGLFIVADGVGTTGHGRLAARLVTELLPIYLRRHARGDAPASAETATLLSHALAELSDDLHAHTESGPEAAHTTVVAAVVTATRAVVAHLGDSRAYLYRDRQIRRLTHDHNVAQALVDAGEITAAQADGHPMRTMLTRHMGMMPPAEPVVCEVDLAPGDRVLLCTDGLHDAVDDQSLAPILTANRHPDEACTALVDAAKRAESPNNITAVVVDVCPSPPAD